jgi:Sap, sulfolipid-1-addressing protein
MWQAVGHLLPIAVAVAVSSVPIMVMIMILLSPKRKLAALAFMCGWVIGIALVVYLCALGARALPEPPRRTQDTLAGVLKIVIGATLICASVVTLVRRSRSPTAGVPSWLRSVGSFGPLPSFAVAVALNFRPKGLVLGAAAGLVLLDASLRPSEIMVAIAIYTGLAASTIAVPVLATLVAPTRVEPRLVTAQAWLSKNGAILAALMLFMIGVVILGDGIAEL